MPEKLYYGLFFPLIGVCTTGPILGAADGHASVL